MNVAPGPPSEFFFGHLRRLRKDAAGLFVEAMQEHGDVVRLERLGKPVHLLFHPDHIKQVLQENYKGFVRQSPGYAKMRSVMGYGLVTSDGELWRKQRRLAQPAFHRERIAGFVDGMTRSAKAMLDRWAVLAKGPKPVVDVADEMMRVTLGIVCETILGSSVANEVDTIGRALGYVLTDASERVSRLVDVPPSIPTPKNKRFQTELATLDAIVQKTIAEHQQGAGETNGREKSDRKKNDLVQMLLDARDEETGEGMSAGQLRDEIMTMFFVGHDTTALALTWTLFCLSRHPEARRMVREEVQSVLAGRTPTVDDLPKLKCLDRVIKESMRLYPPVWIFTRTLVEPARFGNYELPAGSSIVLSPYATHRHKAFWENPEGFDPDRFLPGKDADRPRHAYFPFGGGPRTCIGNVFAMTEAVVLLAMIAQRFDLNCIPGFEPELHLGFTLKPKNGMPMSIRSPNGSLT